MDSFAHGARYIAAVIYLFEFSPTLYQRGDRQSGDAARDGHRPVLGLAWHW